MLEFLIYSWYRNVLVNILLVFKHNKFWSQCYYQAEWVYPVQFFLSYWHILYMVIGGIVELAVRKIGQLISNPTNIYWKRFLHCIQKETMIGIKQFLCVLCTICSFRMLTFSWVEYCSPFSITPTLFSLWSLMLQTIS